MTALLGAALAASVFAAAPAEDRAYVGVYLSDVSGFELKEGRFHADLHVWVKWQGGEEPPAISFVNGELDSREEVAREADGDWRSVRWRVQGTFRGTFPLQDFPFDRQQLQVELSVPTGGWELLPDLASSGVSERFSVTGWLYEPYFEARAHRRTVASDLGSIEGEGDSRILPVTTFSVELERPFAAYLLKFLLPLAVILAMGVLSFLVAPSELEVRASLAVTALLSVVAFHFTQADSLPDVSYLVVADKLFLAAYALVFVILIATVAAHRLHEARPRVIARMDRALVGGLPVACVAIALALIGPTRRPPAEAPAPAVAVTPAPDAKTELRYGMAVLNSLYQGKLQGLLYRGPTYLDGAGQRRPHLLEEVPSMTNSTVRFLAGGGMTVRWTLRPRLRWSDGTPLTSADLEFSLGLVDDASRVSVRRVDDRTIVATYRDRRPGALEDFWLYPRHAAEPLAKEGGRAALIERGRTEALPGDGPFRLVSFDPKAGALFERNPWFAGTPPRLARLRVVLIGAGGGPAAFGQGDVDLSMNLSVESRRAAAAIPGVRIRVEQGDSLTLLQPDLSVPALADPRVRHALLLAVDRARVAQLLYGEEAQVARSFRPPAAVDHLPALPAVPFDPAQARRQLAEAGALPLSLNLTYLDAPAGTPYQQAVETIRAGLTTAGVTVTPVPLSVKRQAEVYERGGHGGLLFATRATTGPPQKFFNLPATEGEPLRPLPHFDGDALGLAERLSRALFEERRTVISRRLQQVWARELPLLPIAFTMMSSAHSERLRGYAPGDTASPFWNVETWELSEPVPAPGDAAVVAGEAAP